MLERDALLEAVDRLQGDVSAIDRALAGGGQGQGQRQGQGQGQSYRSSHLTASGGSVGGVGGGGRAGEEQLLFASSMCTEQRTEVVTGLAPQLQHLQDR